MTRVTETPGGHRKSIVSDILGEGEHVGSKDPPLPLWDRDAGDRWRSLQRRWVAAWHDLRLPVEFKRVVSM